MQITDNFLPVGEFEEVRKYIFSHEFDWHLCPTISGLPNRIDQYQFYHSFEVDKYPYVLDPILKKLQVRQLLRLKANCRPRTSQSVLSDYHVDMRLNQQTAIFYLNTTNGYTQFEDNTQVLSVANRVLTFDGSLMHCGSSCTDTNYRILLNINYLKF